MGIQNASADTALYESLRDHEGEKLCPYKDSNGNATIGVGTCFSKKCGGKKKVSKLLGRPYNGGCISKAESNKLLEKHTANIKSQVGGVVKGLSPKHKHVIIELVYIKGNVNPFRKIISLLLENNIKKAKGLLKNTKICRQLKTRCNDLADNL